MLRAFQHELELNIGQQDFAELPQQQSLPSGHPQKPVSGLCLPVTVSSNIVRMKGRSDVTLTYVQSERDGKLFSIGPID